MGINYRYWMKTVKCMHSLSILHYLRFYAKMPLYSSLTIYSTLRVQIQSIDVLVVASFNAKLYWSLNIFKNIHVLGNIELIHFVENRERNGFFFGGGHIFFYIPFVPFPNFKLSDIHNHIPSSVYFELKSVKGPMDFSMKARPSEYRCDFLSWLPLKLYSKIQKMSKLCGTIKIIFHILVQTHAYRSFYTPLSIAFAYIMKEKSR